MNNSEYYVVTVKEEEIVGYNQKKGEDIVKKHTYNYLVKTADPKEATTKVENEMKSSMSDWRITNVKMSNITEVLD